MDYPILEKLSNLREDIHSSADGNPMEEFWCNGSYE